jgi:hypothetical protein
MKLKNINRITAILIFGLAVISCTENKKTSENMGKEYEKGTFGYDLNYLSEKDSIILLRSDDEKAQVILSAKYQAKVFTSTANGLDGNSHGFVNYNFFDSGVVDEHMNVYGLGRKAEAIPYSLNRAPCKYTITGILPKQ